MAQIWPAEQNKYLGDGVYISHDNFQLWLHVGGVGSIALEPEVYAELRSIGDEFFKAEK